MTTPTTTAKPKTRKPTKGEQRQAQVDAALEALGDIDIDAATGHLENLKSELEDMQSNLEEKSSETERYQAISAAVDALETALSSLNEAQGALGEAVAELESITLDW